MSQLEHLKWVRPFEWQACCCIITGKPFWKRVFQTFPKTFMVFYDELRTYVFQAKESITEKFLPSFFQKAAFDLSFNRRVQIMTMWSIAHVLSLRDFVPFRLLQIICRSYIFYNANWYFARFNSRWICRWCSYFWIFI